MGLYEKSMQTQKVLTPMNTNILKAIVKMVNNGDIDKLATITINVPTETFMYMAEKGYYPYKRRKRRERRDLDRRDEAERRNQERREPDVRRTEEERRKEER